MFNATLFIQNSLISNFSLVFAFNDGKLSIAVVQNFVICFGCVRTVFRRTRFSQLALISCLYMVFYFDNLKRKRDVKIGLAILLFQLFCVIFFAVVAVTGVNDVWLLPLSWYLSNGSHSPIFTIEIYQYTFLHFWLPERQSYPKVVRNAKNVILWLKCTEKNSPE